MQRKTEEYLSEGDAAGGWLWRPTGLICIKAARRRTVILEFMSTPICPECGSRMKRAKVTPSFGGLPELRTFRCATCNVVFTEVVTGPEAIAERACVLNVEASLAAVRQ